MAKHGLPGPLRGMGRRHGQGVIQTLGLLFVTLLVGAFAVDAGMYFNLQHGMQNAADAAALAGAGELFRGQTPDLGTRLDKVRQAAIVISQQNLGFKLDSQDIEFGFYNVKDHSYTDTPFIKPSESGIFHLTGGYNAVRVTVRAGKNRANKPLPSFFARIVGIRNFTAQAQAIAVYAGGVERARNLRPLFMCQAAWDEAAKQYSDPTLPQITMYGVAPNVEGPYDDPDGNQPSGQTTVQVGSTTLDTTSTCPPIGLGNWGLADFANAKGEPQGAEVRNWFDNGYSNDVVVNQDYESQAPRSADSYRDSLDTLIARRAVVPVPLYSATTENGAKFKVSSIVGFQLEAKNTASEKPYIRGHFQKLICHNDCALPPAPLTSGGMTKIRLVR